MSKLTEQIQQEFDRLNDAERCYNEVKDLVNDLYKKEHGFKVSVSMSHIAMLEYIKEMYYKKQTFDETKNYTELINHIVDLYRQDEPTNFVPIVSLKGIMEYLADLHERAQKPEQKSEPYRVERINPKTSRVTHSFDSAESLLTFLKQSQSSEHISKLLKTLDEKGYVDTAFARYKHATED